MKMNFFKNKDACVCCGEFVDKILINNEEICPSCELTKIEVKYI